MEVEEVVPVKEYERFVVKVTGHGYGCKWG